MIETGELFRRLTILIPAFGAAERLAICLESLEKYASQAGRIFVLDDGTPNDSIEICCHQRALSNLSYQRSESNRGFVATCNWGFRDVAEAGSDILLLNSDTELTEGAIEEMLRVLYLHERHAVVTPRSNNATIYSIPFGARDIDPEESFAIWSEIKADLPAYQVMPTAVGFCMLIRGSVLQRFGPFDLAYSPGYNEENDFVCRINRYGYSAIAANHAFVYHYESSSFGPRRKALEKKHHRLLVDRYPEYAVKTSNYVEHELDPVEKFGVLRRKHRPSLFYDLFHLPAAHNGTTEFTLSLLRELHSQIEDEWDVFVGVGSNGPFFANELRGYRLYEDRMRLDTIFDIAFKPAQIFTWDELRRMHRLSPRISFVLQDIIAVRCDYLAYPARKTIFLKTVELADEVYTISDFSRADFEAYFGIKLPGRTIHHGTNAGLSCSEIMPGEYLLMVGNSFAHKGLNEALEHLTDVGQVRVIGGKTPVKKLPENIVWVPSGELTRSYVRELYARAKLLVYPSFYEGYGLPIIEALSLGKPVIAIDNELNRELARSLKDDSLTLIESLTELKDTVMKILGTDLPKVNLPLDVRRWSHVAKDYLKGLQELMKRPQDASKMRARNELIRVLDSAGHF